MIRCHNQVEYEVKIYFKKDAEVKNCVYFLVAVGVI